MSEHYDSLETRTPVLRDSEELALLPKIVAHAMGAPGWAAHLKGVDPKSVTSRAPCSPSDFAPATSCTTRFRIT